MKLKSFALIFSLGFLFLNFGFACKSKNQNPTEKTPTQTEASENSDKNISNAQLKIPKGTPVQLDGKFSENEWTDAEKVEITLPDKRVFEVVFKYDGENILVGFNSFSEKDEWYPEVLLNPNFEQTDSWQSDDWWFHASYSDCASKGKPNDYGTCKLEVPHWEAYNCGINGTGEGEGHPKSIEMKIPFKTIDFEPETGKSIGIAFNVTDTSTRYYFYPETAKMNVPASWAKAVLK